MAKDNLGLLNEISNQLKKLNQSNIRQQMEVAEYQQKQLALQAGGGVGEAQGQGPQIIDAAEDFKRRAKASIFSTKLSEKVTDSGKRAKYLIKENKKKEKRAKEDQKDKKVVSLRKKDRYVGLSTLNDSIQELDNEDTLTTLKLIKVNSDALVQMLGGIRHHLGMSNKATEKARKAAIKAAMNAKRDKVEEKRERDDTVKKMGKIGVLAKGKPGGGVGGNSLMGLLVSGLIAAGAGAVKNIINGFKTEGMGGAIKALFLGNGEGGLGNAIAAAFGTGATFATAGLLIGGPVGALVGGIIGLAVGGLTGWLGEEKIADMMKGAGDTVRDGMDKIKFTFQDWVRNFGAWIYTPGQSGAEVGPHGTVTKTKLFGGLISWDLGIGDRIGKAWRDGKKWVGDLIHKWALKVYNPETNELFGGLFTMPAWFDTVEDTVAAVWNGLKNFGSIIKQAVIKILPDWFTDAMGWTVNGKIPESPSLAAATEGPTRGYGKAEALMAGATTWMGDSNAAVLERTALVGKVRGDYGLGATNAGRIAGNMISTVDANGNSMNNGAMTNYDANGDWMGTPGSPARLLYIARKKREMMPDAMEGYGNRTTRGDMTVNTDASSNVGAVVINNNYIQGSLSGGTDIHTHMVKGVYPPSMMPSNPFFKMAGQY